MPAAAPWGTCPDPAALEDRAELDRVGGGGIVVGTAAEEEDAACDAPAPCSPGGAPGGGGRGPPLAKGTKG